MTKSRGGMKSNWQERVVQADRVRKKCLRYVVMRIQGLSNIAWLMDIVGRHSSEMCIIKMKEPNFEKKEEEKEIKWSVNESCLWTNQPISPANIKKIK